MFLITPRLAGTRTAAAQSTLGAVRAGATPLGPAAPEPAPRTARMAVSLPDAMPASMPAAVPVPAGPIRAAEAAPATAAAPTPLVPAPARSSIVVDLDAMSRKATTPGTRGQVGLAGRPS
jgi:hypothetical protein